MFSSGGTVRYEERGQGLGNTGVTIASVEKQQCIP